MILEWLEEAVACGAGKTKACEQLGLSLRTIQRWRKNPRDRRPESIRPNPTNTLSEEERQEILELLVSPKYRDLSPNQIVPRLADEGIYLASESTLYRLLRKARLQRHRERSRPVRNRRPEALEARGPNQVWSWDITYLKSPVRGQFFFLYMFVDVWSRRIMGWMVSERESSEQATILFEQVSKCEGIRPGMLTLHQDNGAPMKGVTFLATLEKLGVAASFSRPSVSNDNAFSESLYRTLKYRPEYPSQPFHSLEQAREWVARFVDWYNHVHRHSAIRFVTPEQRHSRQDESILRNRAEVYEQARVKNPLRWSRQTRCWDPVQLVVLNQRCAHHDGVAA